MDDDLLNSLYYSECVDFILEETINEQENDATAKS